MPCATCLQCSPWSRQPGVRSPRAPVRLPADDRAALRADIIAELDELTALVGDVVELARGSKPGRVLDDVRVDRIVAALIERAQGRRGVDVEFRAELEPTVVRGEP